MNDSEFQTATSALVDGSRAAREKGSPSLERRIRAFEMRYEMTSDELRRRLASGDQAETAEICEWLLLLAAREGRVAG